MVFEEEAEDYPQEKKEKFTRTQKIEFKDSEEGDKINKHSRRNGSFSKTLSKTSLLAKIRTAMGKQILVQQNRILQQEGGQKKTPRRFIVKRSQERTGKIESQHDEIVKNMVTQKEQIAGTQKEALKKERELSLKLRQAIQNLGARKQ
jgi:hypothetical protein